MSNYDPTPPAEPESELALTSPRKRPGGPALDSEPLRCSEILRRPVAFVHEAETVAVAARTMREVDVGFLPVCESSGAVIGVLTDRDIVTRACLNVGGSAAGAAGGAALGTDNSGGLGAVVRTVMTRGVIACRPDDPVTKALALMRKHRVSRLVIADANRHAIGVLSLSDIAQYERPARVGRTLRAIAERKYGPERP